MEIVGDGNSFPRDSAAEGVRSGHGAVEAYFRCWNDGGYGVLEELLADEWFDHSHPERRNAADVRQAFDTARALNPDTQVLLDAVLGDGALIEVNGRIVRGPFEEGRVWIVKTVDGRLREMWMHTVD
jgi:hypothetical protein